MKKSTTPRRPNPTETERTLGALLRLAYDKLARRVYQRLAESGYPEIRRAHSVVLRSISPDGSKIVELAAAAQMRKQSMGDLVRYLHKHGYVEFKADPDDARARLVCLTRKGEKLHQCALDISKEVEQEVGVVIGGAGLEQLRRSLEVLAGLPDLTGRNRKKGGKSSATAAR